MGRYSPYHDYKDPNEPKWYVKAVLLGLLCGAVWLLLKCVGPG